jgi:hypothetical protein
MSKVIMMLSPACLLQYQIFDHFPEVARHSRQALGNLQRILLISLLTILSGTIPQEFSKLSKVR